TDRPSSLPLGRRKFLSSGCQLVIRTPTPARWKSFRARRQTAELSVAEGIRRLLPASTQCRDEAVAAPRDSPCVAGGENLLRQRRKVGPRGLESEKREPWSSLRPC